jgi:hypothetical protein
MYRFFPVLKFFTERLSISILGCLAYTRRKALSEFTGVMERGTKQQHGKYSRNLKRTPQKFTKKSTTTEGTKDKITRPKSQRNPWRTQSKFQKNSETKDKITCPKSPFTSMPMTATRKNGKGRLV